MKGHDHASGRRAWRGTAQLDALRTAGGLTLDRMFLELMVRHHQQEETRTVGALLAALRA